MFKKKKSKNDFDQGSTITIKNKKTKVLIYVALTIAAILVVLPLLWLLFTSFKSRLELTKNTWGLPKVWEFSNYVVAWTGSKIPLYMINSIRATAIAIILTIVLSTPVSYVISRFRFKGKRFLYMFFIAGMMIPIHSTVIPIYTMVGDMNLNNNLEILGLVYGAFRIPISIFILEGFMSALPRELEECAVIDGCSTANIFFSTAFQRWDCYNFNLNSIILVE